ncbi:MAG: B12-binding domain-containing radical SAM protein [Nitrospirae bacterium]|nr:B12-binding domain-containing radical SAM protein [Nitrospirota bacterium]
MPPYFAPAVLGYARHSFKGELEVKVMDGLLHSFSPEEVRKTADEWGADAAFVLLGIDLLESDASFAELSCPVFAQICPVTVDPEEAIELYGLSIPYFIYGGETEVTLVSALRELSDTGSVEHTPGLVINHHGTATRKTEWPKVSDMATYPLPAYDLFDIPEYISRQVLVESRENYRYSALVKTMKGCLFQCIFCTCSSPGQQARYKSAAQVIEELKMLKGYGFHRVVFIDQEFGVNINRAKDICKRISAEGLNIRYLVNNRIDLVDEELMYFMKASGCEMVRYGIESADPKVMARINKKVDLRRASDAIKITRAAGIPVNLFFLIGLPGEDKETLRLNADFIINNQADSYSMGRVFLIPNTALYKQVKEEGRILVRDWQLYRKNEGYQFKHEYYKSFKQLKRAERKLLNLINRARLTTYRVGRWNERIYAFLSSFSVFSIHMKERFPKLYNFLKIQAKKLLNV